MKALLFCPVASPEIAALSARATPAALPLLGETLAAYWLVHLASLGAKEVTILAPDRPEEIRQAVGDGARWGLRVEVVAVAETMTLAEARPSFQGVGHSEWLPAPNDLILMDRLPGLPGAGLFGSYAQWFAASQSWMSRALTPDRVGAHEIRPGIRVGLHGRIPADAVLNPPCWIGDQVFLGAGVTVGPMTALENRVVVEAGAEISHSIVGPDTFVGRLAELHDSIAWGDTLINWKSGSSLRVTAGFLLSSLGDDQRTPPPALRRPAWNLSRLWSPPEPPAVSPALVPPFGAAERDRYYK
ncbi:MAG: hypothetical protein HY302_08610 [Opitutae bacterium]|nr:hypothetical protein [Opitutae bacterium]